MPEWGYSLKTVETERTVKCSGRELKISPKGAVEICRTIRGMRLEDSRTLLERVIDKKRAIVYRRFKKEVPHRTHEERGYAAGRYPVKAAERILRLLGELESNAEYKGLNIEKLRIIHAAAHMGMKSRKYIHRAFGRSSPFFNTLTHIELVGYEEE